MNHTIEINPCHFCDHRTATCDQCDQCEDHDQFSHKFKEKYVYDVYALTKQEKQLYFSKKEDIEIDDIMRTKLLIIMKKFGITCRYKKIVYREKEQKKGVIIIISHPKKCYDLSLDYSVSEIKSNLFYVSLTETIIKYVDDKNE